MKFLRNLLAAILGCLIAFGILFVLFFVFAALVGSAGDGVTVKENLVLKISISEPVYDYYGVDESDPFAGLFEEGQGLDQILHAIKVAKTDNRIQGISIKNNFLFMGLAQTQEVRKALEDFKESGKKVHQPLAVLMGFPFCCCLFSGYGRGSIQKGIDFTSYGYGKWSSGRR